MAPVITSTFVVSERTIFEVRECCVSSPERHQYVRNTSREVQVHGVHEQVLNRSLPLAFACLLTAALPGACSGSSASPAAPPLEAGSYCDDLQPTACVGTASQTVCDASGAWVEQTCDALCGGVGFTNKGCTDNKCQCATRMDDQCAAGADAYCACNTCTGSANVNAYVNCFVDDPAGTRAELRCVGQYLDAQGHADC